MAVPSRPVPGAPIESAWGSVVHDSAVAQDVQSGQAVISVPAGGARFDYTLTFPRAFGAAPVVCAWALNGAVHLAVGVALPQAVSTIIGVCRRDGATLTASSVTVSWQAIGPRA